MFVLLVLLGIAGLVAVDQLTKVLAVTYLRDGPVALWDGVFDLTYVENRGAAFGLGQGYGWLFAVLTVILSCGILWLLFSTRRFRHPLAVASGMLIVAGGIGNLIDRVGRGFVVDFLYFKLIDFPVFNVADCCVVIGAILLAVYVLFIYREPEAKSDERPVVTATGEEGSKAVQSAESVDGAGPSRDTGTDRMAKEARADGLPDADRPAGGGGDEA